MFYFKWPCNTDSQLSTEEKFEMAAMQTDIQTSMEVLVGHTVMAEAESIWHRGSGMGHWDDSYLQNKCLANLIKD